MIDPEIRAYIDERIKLHLHDGLEARQITSSMILGGIVAGSDQQVQFNDGGLLAGNAAFTFIKSLYKILIGAEGSTAVIAGPAAVSTDVAGSGVEIDGGLGNGAGAGGLIYVNAGNGGATGRGGDAYMLAGNAGSSGDLFGGSAYIYGGNAHGAKIGGQVQLAAGAGGATGNGGDIYLTVGNGGSGNRGNIYMDVGTNSTTRNGGFMQIPLSAGIPTGTPTGATGALVYDTANNDFYIYNGGWKKVHLA